MLALLTSIENKVALSTFDEDTKEEVIDLIWKALDEWEDTIEIMISDWFEDEELEINLEEVLEKIHWRTTEVTEEALSFLKVSLEDDDWCWIDLIQVLLEKLSKKTKRRKLDDDEEEIDEEDSWY